MILNSPYISGSLTVTGNITAQGGISISGSIASASYAANAELLDGLDSSVFVLSSSFQNYSSSNDGKVAALNTFSASILSYTSSTDDKIAQLNRETASLNLATASINNATASLYNTTASLNAAVSDIRNATASLYNATASIYNATASLYNATASLYAATASIYNFTSSANLRIGSLEQYTQSLNTRSASFACVTATNNFSCTQYFSNTSNAVSFTSTGSLYSDGGVRITRDMYVSGTAFFNNVTVFGTQSINYISSSQLNIASNIISVNTATPTVRFGGLAVYDSGSLGTGLTGSLLWDSEDNQWIYSNPSGSIYDSALFLVGPRSTGPLGSEVGISCNFLSKGNGMHHMTSSGIFEDGSRTCFYSNSRIDSSGNICNAGSVCSNNIVLSTGYSASATASVQVWQRTGGAVAADMVYNDANTSMNFGTSTAHALNIKTNNSTALNINSAGVSSFFNTVCAPIFVGTTNVNTGTSCVVDSHMININGDQASVNVGLALRNTNISFPKVYGLTNVNGNLNLYDYTANSQRLRIDTNGIACFACQVCTPGMDIMPSGIGVSTLGGIMRVVTGGTSTGIAVGQSNANRYTHIAANDIQVFNDDFFLSTRCAFPLSIGTCYTARLTFAATGIATFTCQVCAPMFLASGCIGIGCTTPTSPLTIRSDSNSGASFMEIATCFQNSYRYVSINAGSGISYCIPAGTSQSPYIEVQGGAPEAGGGSFKIRTGAMGSVSDKLIINQSGIACFASRVCAPFISVGRNAGGDTTDYSLTISRYGDLVCSHAYVSTPAFSISQFTNSGPTSGVDTAGIWNLSLGRSSHIMACAKLATLMHISYDGAVGPLRVDGRGNMFIGYDRSAQNSSDATFSLLVMCGIAAGSYQYCVPPSGGALFSGNVGIGTPSPGAPLHICWGSSANVNPTLIVEGAVANNDNYPRVRFKGGTYPDAEGKYPQLYITNGGLGIYLAGGYSAVYNNPTALGLNNGTITLETGNAGSLNTRMAISSTGVVRIGACAINWNTNSNVALQVAGAIRFGNPDGEYSPSYGGGISARSCTGWTPGSTQIIVKGLGGSGFLYQVQGFTLTGKRFTDLLFGVNTTFSVIASQNENTPATRCYTITSENLNLCLSGTDNYNVVAHGFGAVER